MNTYTLEENEEDGSFSFDGKTEKISPDELKTLQALQPDSIWMIFCDVETYRKFEQERKTKI